MFQFEQLKLLFKYNYIEIITLIFNYLFFYNFITFIKKRNYSISKNVDSE